MEALHTCIERRDVPAAQDVLRDMGREALSEHASWLLLRRARPFDVPVHNTVERRPTMRRIFISATSRDLGSYRRAVRNVLLSQGVLPETHAEAEPLYHRALGIFATVYGVQHPSTQTVTENFQALLAALDWPTAQIAATLRQVLHGEA